MAHLVRKIENEEDLEKVLTEAGTKLVVIDFFAAWCGPCKVIAPKVEELAKLCPDVVFCKVDVDACETIAEKYGISSMPTFHFVKEKKKLENFSGASFEKLQAAVQKLK